MTGNFVKMGVGAVATLSLLSLAAAPSGAAQYAHPKIHKWYASQGGKQAINHVTADFTAIGNDANSQDVAALGTDCQTLRNDAQIALALRPIPSPSVERLWVAALNDYQQGATYCVNGVNDDSGSEIEQATGDFTSGAALVTHLSSEL